MNSRHLITLVANREIRDRLSSRPFMISTLISVLAIVAVIVGPALFGGDDELDPLALGVMADAALAEQFEVAAAASTEAYGWSSLSLRTYDTRAQADAAVDQGDVDGVVLSPTEVLVASPGSQLDEFLGYVAVQANTAEFLAATGTDAASLQAALTPPDIRLVTLDGLDDDSQEQQFGVGFIITILLFVTLQVNGAAILTTTVEEKSSRVVEVLLGVLRPWQLLAGKLVAMTILSVGQLLLYAAAAYAAASAVGDVQLPDTAASVVVTGLVMFLAGFGLYAAIYAVAGSLAHSTEEAQGASTPIAIISIAVYAAVIIGVVPDPQGTLARVLTFIPFSAPFAVPVRANAGIPAWEVAVAFVLTALTTVLVVRLAGRLYSAAVLSGGRMGWRDAFRAEPIR